MSITTADLYKNQYDYNTLKTNIYVVSLMDILKTQRLTADFCVKYILNTDFQFTDEDQSITIYTVKKYQPHILDIDLQNAIIIATNKKMRRERIDSFEDFESYMNRHI
jgi:hypothetical protein